MERLRTVDIPLTERTYGQVLARQARRNGDRTFLRFEDQHFSYAETDRITNRIANGLLKAGIKHGDHVAILLDNCPELLWTYFALGKIGAVSVPVNTAAKGELLTYYLTQSDSVALVIDHRLVERFAVVADQCPQVGALFVHDEEGDGTLPGIRPQEMFYAALERNADTPPDVTVRFSDVFCLFYTSGTTGPSKGNICTHAQGIGGSAAHVEFFGYRPEDTIYTCLPVFHGNAMNCSCVPALLADATLAISRRFSASRFWDEVREVGATAFNLLGAMTNILWAQPPSPRDRDHKVRQCMMVPIASFGREFEERFGIKLTSVYALTDFGNVSFLGPSHPPEKLQSSGQVRPEVQVAILDDDDLPLPTGTVGEICVRGNQPWVHAKGYYKMPEATAQAWANSWFHTGDRGYIDADDYLYFVDRKKDAIRRRGENISSWEVERIIARHPAVEDVAVFPVRSEMSEDEVMATVTLRESATLEPLELMRFCEDNMAYFMVPRFIEIVPELPRTMTQKIEKYKLRQDAEARLAQIWDRERLGIKVRR